MLRLFALAMFPTLLLCMQCREAQAETASVQPSFSIRLTEGQVIREYSPTISWTALADTRLKTYRYVVGLNRACAAPYQNTPRETTNLSTVVPAPLSNGKFYFCTWALFSDGSTQAAANNGVMFEIKVAPGAPQPPAPSLPAFSIQLMAGQVFTTLTPTFSWSPLASSSPVTYRYTIDVNADCAAPFQNSPRETTSTSAVAPTSLANGKFYYCVWALVDGQTKAASNNGVMFEINTSGGTVVTAPPPPPAPPVIAPPPPPITGTTNYTISPTPAESVSFAKHGLDQMAHIVGDGDFKSPIMTHKGFVYTAWVDDYRKLWVAKIDPVSGATQKTLLWSNVDDDPYHMGASVGVDAEGFIHVVGNMHHSPYNRKASFPEYQYAWQYWVSNAPESVGSFTFLGNNTTRTIPGTWISYARFYRNQAGTLFVAFRHRVHFGGGWDPGSIAAAIARYDRTTKTWSMLGGTSYAWGSETATYMASKSSGKTFFWQNAGADGTAYQKYLPEIFFDRRGRMHITIGVQDGSPTTANFLTSHIVYVYSDDEGKTFYRANGTLISQLPVQLSTATVAFDKTISGTDANGKTNGFGRSHVGVAPDGTPIVAAWADGTKRRGLLRKWNQAGYWEAPIDLGGSYGTAISTNYCGYLSHVMDRKIRRSTDGGKTWREYPVDIAYTTADRVLLDDVFHAATGHFRFLLYDPSGNITRVGTIQLNGLSTCAP